MNPKPTQRPWLNPTETPSDALSTYPLWMRAVDTLALVSALLGSIYYPYHVDLEQASSWAHSPLYWLFGIALAICSLMTADFISGIAHWLADTYGSVRTPVLGPALIRPFREHHLRPRAMTQHDFIETNGSSALLYFLFVLLPLNFAKVYDLAVVSCVLSFGFAIIMTNQIHKWSHMKQPPKLIRWLQRNRLILNARDHARHHSSPYTHNYCITLGWSNRWLERLGFFRKAERLIEFTLGLAPRKPE